MAGEAPDVLGPGLVRGAAVAAVAAVAEVYAGTEWTSANAAAAGRDQLAGLTDDRALAAMAAGQDELFAAWQALASVASQGLALRAQQLPQLVGDAPPSPPPALALTDRLYHAAAQANELVANNAPHPLFMSSSGQAWWHEYRSGT